MPEDDKPPIDLQVITIVQQGHATKGCAGCKGMMFRRPGCIKRAADEAKAASEAES